MPRVLLGIALVLVYGAASPTVSAAANTVDVPHVPLVTAMVSARRVCARLFRVGVVLQGVPLPLYRRELVKRLYARRAAVDSLARQLVAFALHRSEFLFGTLT